MNLGSKLTVIKLKIEAFFREKLIMISGFNNVSVLHDHDDVSFSDGGESVGDDEARSTLHKLIKSSLDSDLSTGIN